MNHCHFQVEDSSRGEAGLRRIRGQEPSQTSGHHHHRRSGQTPIQTHSGLI